jgi:hypothetical protein
MLKLKKLSFICIIALFVFTHVKAEQAMENNVIKRLQQSETLEEFDRLTRVALKERDENIYSLIRMLRSEPEKEKKIRICYLLGEYKAIEAIWDLAKNITLEAQVSDETKLPRWGKYPAQEALIKCGFRSIRYMISNIESSDDKQIQNLSVGVIWLVIGEGLSNYSDGKEYARMIIQKRINQESDPVKKERLEAAFGYLADHRKKAPGDTQRKKGSE